MPEMPGGTDGVPRLPVRMKLPPEQRRRLYWESTEQGEHPEHLPQNQRANRTTSWAERRGKGSRSAEPDDVRLGAVLQLGPSLPSLRGDRRARDKAASTVARAEAQGKGREVRALSERTAVRSLRSDPPCADDGGPSVGENMISSESRTPEIGTSGLMSGEKKHGYARD